MNKVSPISLQFKLPINFVALYDTEMITTFQSVVKPHYMSNRDHWVSFVQHFRFPSPPPIQKQFLEPWFHLRDVKQTKSQHLISCEMKIINVIKRNYFKLLHFPANSEEKIHTQFFKGYFLELRTGASYINLQYYYDILNIFSLKIKINDITSTVEKLHFWTTQFNWLSEKEPLSKVTVAVLANCLLKANGLILRSLSRSALLK